MPSPEELNFELLATRLELGRARRQIDALRDAQRASLFAVDAMRREIEGAQRRRSIAQAN